MPSDRKYYSSPLYYPDDKDLRDFMRATSVGDRKLRYFLSSRGIFPPKQLSKDLLIERISRLTLGWADLVQLVDLVDIGDRKENSTFEDIDYPCENSSINDAFQQVKELRQDPQKETYRIREVGERIVVEVDYVTVDQSKTPMLQGRPAQLTLEVEKSGDSFRVTHTSNDIASAIMNDFLTELAKLESSEGQELDDPIARAPISMKGVLSAELRVNFFKTLAKGLSGHSYERATNAKIARFPLKDGARAKITSEDGLSEVEEKALRGVILQGIDIEQSAHYKEFLENGFFISSLTWDTLDLTNNDRVSFTAGFKKAEEGDRFEFCVNHKSRFDQGDYKIKEKIPAATRRKLAFLVQESARVAMESIQVIADSTDAGPSAED